MKRILVFLIILALTSTLSQAQFKLKDLNINKKFNWGIRAGGNGAFLNILDYKIGGVTETKPQANSQLGFVGSIFSRYNFKRNFIQLEVSYMTSRTSIQLDPSDFFPEMEIPQKQLLQIREHSQSISIPSLYGLNIVKSSPYLLNFFIGPKVKYIFSNHCKNTQSPRFGLEYMNDDRNYAIYGVAGVSTTIGRLYIDFRYEICCTSFKNNTYTLTPSDISYTPVTATLERSTNELNISVGFFW